MYTFYSQHRRLDDSFRYTARCVDGDGQQLRPSPKSCPKEEMSCSHNSSFLLIDLGFLKSYQFSPNPFLNYLKASIKKIKSHLLFHFTSNLSKTKIDEQIQKNFLYFSRLTCSHMLLHIHCYFMSTFVQNSMLLYVCKGIWKTFSTIP